GVVVRLQIPLDVCRLPGKHPVPRSSRARGRRLQEAVLVEILRHVRDGRGARHRIEGQMADDGVELGEGNQRNDAEDGDEREPKTKADQQLARRPDAWIAPHDLFSNSTRTRGRILCGCRCGVTYRLPCGRSNLWVIVMPVKRMTKRRVALGVLA